MTIELWLPFPPSANHLWRAGRGRVFPSKPYTAWLVEAKDYLKDVTFETVRGPYKLFITAARPDKRKRDLDNLLKSVSDLLKQVGAIEDDHWCEAIHARWVTTGDGVAVRIEKAGIE